MSSQLYLITRNCTAAYEESKNSLYLFLSDENDFFSRVLMCFADIHEVHGKKR